MKQREWMGYAAAVLAAGAFLTGCGNIRKLAKSDPEVGVHLPARSAQNPVAQAADTARTQKIITYRKQDGTERFITPVDVDSLSGEKMMSVAIDEVVISASNRRNLVERNGKINVEFVVSVPQELQARNWQLVVDPQLLKGADTLAFDPLVYSGDRFRTMQRREYARYDDYLGRIVDSADYSEQVRRQRGLFPLYGPRGGAADEVCRRRSPSGTDDARGGDVRQAGGMDDARGAPPAVRPAAPLRHGDRPQGAGTDLLHAGRQRQVRPSERLFCAALPACLYGRRRAARRRDLHPRAGRIPGRRGP